MLLAKLKISGHSMQPFLNPGDEVIISSFPYFFLNPKIGDIVAFEKQGKIFVKRVGFIKNNEFFLQGDNKKDSMDSRTFGIVLKKQILGKVIYKI